MQSVIAKIIPKGSDISVFWKIGQGSTLKNPALVSSEWYPTCAKSYQSDSQEKKWSDWSEVVLKFA